MQLATFLLDHWLNHYHFRSTAIKYDLSPSTGPNWTLRQLLELAGEGELEAMLDTRLVYADRAGKRSLREAIAEMQGLSADDVLVTTGAAEGLLILFFLAAEPGANVILPAPCFPPTAELPRSLGIETRFYHVRRENGFRIDTDEIKSLADGNTKILLVNTPHNPTGATLTDDQLESLHDFASGRGIQFVVDEVYHPIYHGAQTRSAARLPHSVVLGDLSKALCLSGLRVGWIVDRNRERLEKSLDARSYFTISSAALSEQLAEMAVRHSDKIFARAQQVASANLALLEEFFSEHSEVLGWVRPQGGMIAFPWLTSGADARAFCEALAERGVLVAPGDCFGKASHFRLGFGARETGFAEALEILSDCVKQYATRAAKG